MKGGGVEGLIKQYHKKKVNRPEAGLLLLLESLILLSLAFQNELVFFPQKFSRNYY